jgi:hypothetical protein
MGYLLSNFVIPGILGGLVGWLFAATQALRRTIRERDVVIAAMRRQIEADQRLADLVIRAADVLVVAPQVPDDDETNR